MNVCIDICMFVCIYVYIVLLLFLLLLIIILSFLLLLFKVHCLGVCMYVLLFKMQFPLCLHVLWLGVPLNRWMLLLQLFDYDYNLQHDFHFFPCLSVASSCVVHEMSGYVALQLRPIVASLVLDSPSGTVSHCTHTLLPLTSCIIHLLS